MDEAAGSVREFRSGLPGYWFAGFMVLLATATRGGLGLAAGPLSPFLTFYPAVLLVVTVAGRGPGLCATALAALVADCFFLSPAGSPVVTRAADAIALTVFIATSAALCLLADRLQRRRDLETDAHQRQRVFDDLHAEKERLAAVLDSITDEVWFADVDGRFTLANPAALREFGYSGVDGLDMQRLNASLVVLRGDGTPRPISEAPPVRALAGEIVRDEEEIVLTPATGALRHRRVSSSPVRDANGRVIGAVSVVRDDTEQKRADDQFRAELENRVRARTAELRERDAMLQEIHHRVKNNLQVISSLINMQARAMQDAPTRLALKECRSRVEAMAEIHAMLYQSKDYARVPFAKYARELALRVMRAAETAPSAIGLVFALEEIFLTVDKAIPCGLILNELLSNALKHAFPNARAGTIRLQLERTPDDRIALSVGDDGIGIPADFEPHKAQSLGVQLIVNLVQQLDGVIDIAREGGTAVRIIFAPESRP